jgi:protoporphyrinogen oxidase
MRLFGPEAVKYFVDPVVRLAGGTRMDLVSPVILRSGFSDFSKLISLRGGLDRVPKAVAAKLKVRYDTKVQVIRSEADKVVLQLTDASGQAGEFVADKCLVTAQFDDAERIYPRFAQLRSAIGQSFPYMRMIDIKLAYRQRTRSKAWGVFVPFCEDPDINFLTLTHNKSPDRAPEGHSLIGIFTEDLEYDRQAAMTDEQIVAWARSRAEALHPELKGHFLFSYVSRQPRTCGLPVPGHFRRARAFWDAIGQEPRVHLAGDMFIYGSMECAVSIGERAADRLVQGGR